MKGCTYPNCDGPEPEFGGCCGSPATDRMDCACLYCCGVMQWPPRTCRARDRQSAQPIETAGLNPSGQEPGPKDAP